MHFSHNAERRRKAEVVRDNLGHANIDVTPDCLPQVLVETASGCGHL